jgi:hypothetical protein
MNNAMAFLSSLNESRTAIATDELRKNLGVSKPSKSLRSFDASSKVP